MLLRLARIGGLFLTMLAAVAVMRPAWARNDNSERSPKLEKYGKKHQVPEIDPAVIGGAVAVLAGGAVLLKSRRTRRTGNRE